MYSCTAQARSRLSSNELYRSPLYSCTTGTQLYVRTAVDDAACSMHNQWLFGSGYQIPLVCLTPRVRVVIRDTELRLYTQLYDRLVKSKVYLRKDHVGLSSREPGRHGCGREREGCQVRQRAPSRLRSDPWLDRVSYAWSTAENKTLLLAILYSDSTVQYC